MASDPKKLQKQVDTAQDEGVQITRNIRDIAVETHGIALDTADTLIRQGEQLDNIDRRLDEVNSDIKEADRNLREIEKCCGCCFCPGSRPKKLAKRKEVYTEQNNPVTQQPRVRERGGPEGGQYVDRVLGDDREAEMNENLKYV